MPQNKGPWLKAAVLLAFGGVLVLILGVTMALLAIDLSPEGKAASESVQGVFNVLGSVFLALSATMATYWLQQRDSRARWVEAIRTELTQTLEVLERPAKGEFKLELPSETLTFSLASITPLVFQDAVKSGLFSGRLGQDLLYLVAKMDAYNLRFNRFLGILQANYAIPEHQASIYVDNWKSELGHIEEGQSEVLALCRKVLNDLD